MAHTWGCLHQSEFCRDRRLCTFLKNLSKNWWECVWLLTHLNTICLHAHCTHRVVAFIKVRLDEDFMHEIDQENCAYSRLFMLEIMTYGDHQTQGAHQTHRAH